MKSMMWIYPLLTSLCLALPAHAATTDRIFADGFDPCCRIGGAVTGLVGSGLVVHLGAASISEDKPISGNGLYDFAATVAPGNTYSVSIGTQPTGGNCSLSNASGSVGSGPVDDIDVTCTASATLFWNQGSWDQATWN